MVRAPSKTSGAFSSTSGDRLPPLSGQGIGVQVLSDNAATGDFPGVFTISHSTYLFGNTQASQDNSTNYSIQGSGNH